MEIKNTLRKVIENYKIENEDLEQDDCDETVLYELFMNRDSKNLIIDKKLEKSLFDTENVIFTKIDESKLEVMLFSDGYEGYRLTLEDDNGKLKVVSSEKVNEDIINNTEDLDISELI